MKRILNSKVLVGVIVCIITFYLAILLIAKPRIANDTAAGFCVMYGWQNGMEWNHSYRVIDGRFIDIFQAWWAPGQYMIPWAFIKIFGLSVGNAVIVPEILSLILFCLGYRRLMRSLGISDMHVYLSLVIILVNRSMNYQIFNYNADVFLVTYSIYFILFYRWSSQRDKAIDTILLLGMSLLGLYLKNSFILVLFSLLLYDLVSQKKYDYKLISRLFLLKAVPVFAAIGLYHKYYISLGENIQASGGLNLSFNNILNAVIKPTVAILSAPFSFNNLLGKISEILSLKATNMEDWRSSEVMIIGAIIFSAAFLIFRPSIEKLKRACAHDYARTVLAFFATYVVFYFYAMITDKVIATDDRLFYILSALATPFLVRHAFHKKSVLIAFGLAVVYSGVGFLIDIKRNMGPTRTRLPNDVAIDGHISPDAIQPYDHRHGIAYLTFPEYCFLLPGKKYVTTDNQAAKDKQSDPANTVVYDSAGYIKIRLGK